MQLSLPFSAVLASVLFMMFVQVADSAPVKRAPKFVTLPLKRVEQARNVHGQIYLQQHMNRGIRRLARMTGCEEPSRRDLHSRLERRILSVEGPEGLEKRFNRFGLPAPSQSSGAKSLADTKENKAGADDNITEANQPTAPNSLGLDIEAVDVGYSATVQVGNPPRDFLVTMDSGSADFWVGSDNCASNGGGCGSHVFLGPESSSSFNDTGNEFKITYGSGSVSGNIVTDDVTIAGLALPGLTFGVATTESVDFSSNNSPNDGLMGLARSSLSEQKTLTPVEALAAANKIPEAIVSYKISRLEDFKNDGEITFGALDPTKFDNSALVTVPNVDKDGFWTADLGAVTVNGADTGLTGRTAILDTGTTLMIVPAADATTIHAGIKGAKSDNQGGFTVPCTLTDKVALQFGSQTFEIDPRDIAFAPINPNDQKGDCVSGIASGNIGGPNQWLVGDVFLKNVYFSTDATKNTITLAKLA
ncbi:hypothetical protein CVT25_015376 [Psilocybe cyanescens]|uniref:Peptidase A1 domain-containing protein n=1 Tax=Psilocybe cyanescens TaxID=93625 RepID=A0A409WHB7_PSICY|nr:hypothetical protein CVT25_015376 [Psilocybe cyanescens]